MLEQEPKLNDAATILEEVMASAGQSAVYEAKRILTRLGMRDLETALPDAFRRAEKTGGISEGVAVSQRSADPG